MLKQLTRTQRFDGADIWLNGGVVAIQARVIEGIQHAGRFSSRLQEREDDQEVFFVSSEIQSARVRPNNVRSRTSCLESKRRWIEGRESLGQKAHVPRACHVRTRQSLGVALRVLTTTVRIVL